MNKKIAVFHPDLTRKAKPHLERMVRDGGSETPRTPKTPGGGGGGGMRRVETIGPHDMGDSQACRVMTGDPAGTLSDSGKTIDCYNGLGDLPSGTRAIAAKISGYWELIQARCSES